MLRICLATAFLLLASNAAEAAVKTRTIKYKDGDLECIGTLAWDDAVSGKRPGVLVVHEWWGLNDYARGRAEKLAALGYVAFACDMYGEGKTVEHAKDAGEMAGKVRANVEAWRKRAAGALDVLKAQPECDGTKLAAMGYCFGGSTALQLAFSGADLKAVVSFHGALPTPTAEEVKQTKPRILVCHGAADTFIPEKAIKGFRDALDAGGAKYEFIAYPDVVHSFTVPDADKHNIPGIKYNKAADEASWKSMRDLFAETLK
jgi:dienelactone hydrolase